jgi:hypothetical protein
LAFRKFEKTYGERVVVYLHPWEIDPEQPRISGSLKSRLRHYTNLGGMEAKVSAVLGRHKFARFSDVLAEEENVPMRSEENTSTILTSPAGLVMPQGKGSR